MEKLNTVQTRDMLLAAAETLIKHQDFLTEIDSQIGDGDHGTGMANGARQAIQALSALDSNAAVEDLFQAAGNAMLMSMGGASGVMFGTLFLEAAQTQPKSGSLYASSLAARFRMSLNAIQKRGGAKCGDKTMVDALEPAVRAMEATESTDFLQILSSAESAARAGVERTKACVAKFGRAKFLKERSLGYQDPGATSVWLIFQGMHQFIEKLSSA